MEYFSKKIFTEAQNRADGTLRLSVWNIFQRKVFTEAQNRAKSTSSLEQRANTL